MTQILVTLENGADPSFLEKMIDNMKGVLRTKILSPANKTKTDVTDTWLEELKELRNMIDHSAIDMDDERTRHIMR